jgi:hypothetical protein
VQSQTAVDGSQAEFSCLLEGSPRPQITWFRQTAIIKPSQDFQVFYDAPEDGGSGTATLVIKEVFPEDAGTFTCVAKNCAGYATSSAELVVEGPLSADIKHDRRSLSRESSLTDIVEGIPPTFAQRPPAKTADEGASAELECRFVAIPEAEVQWFHDKKPVQENSRVSIVYQADMHMYCSMVRISNLLPEDAGVYEVTAKNREGEATNTLVLNVRPKKKPGEPEKPPEEAAEPLSPPVVVKPLTPAVCRLGEAVRMETVIAGKPKPRVSWRHNGAPLAQGRARVVEGPAEGQYALLVDSPAQEDDGDYTVRAENDAGAAQTTANLSVQGELFLRKLDHF